MWHGAISHFAPYIPSVNRPEGERERVQCANISYNISKSTHNAHIYASFGKHRVHTERQERIIPYIHRESEAAPTYAIWSEHWVFLRAWARTCIRIAIYAHTAACMHIPLGSIKTNLIEMTLTRAKCRNNNTNTCTHTFGETRRMNRRHPHFNIKNINSFSNSTKN